MKNVFVKTKNVKNFVTLMDKLQKLPPNIPKLALVYGEHGLGNYIGIELNPEYIQLANNRIKEGI